MPLPVLEILLYSQNAEKAHGTMYWKKWDGKASDKRAPNEKGAQKWWRTGASKNRLGALRLPAPSGDRGSTAHKMEQDIRRDGFDGTAKQKLCNRQWPRSDGRGVRRAKARSRNGPNG